jgi:hypothetical protein
MSWSGVSGNPQVEEINARGLEPAVQPDPGNGGALEVSRPCIIEISTAGVETRTLPDPSFRGQAIDLVMVADGGDCVIAANSPINQAGNNRITLDDVGDHVRLVGKYNATDGWEWSVVCNDGATLATV